MKRFANKTAIVTGASRGMGQTFALRFAQEGAHVVGVASGDLAETSSKIRQAGGQFTPIKCDLGKLTHQSAVALIEEAVSKTGRVDVLVNNAGIIRRAPAVDHPESD